MWDELSMVTKLCGDLCPGWQTYVTLWDILSRVENMCGMCCPGSQTFVECADYRVVNLGMWGVFSRVE